MLSGGTCESCVFPSKEEAERTADEIEKRESAVIIAYTEIKKKHSEDGKSTGEINCPSCNGIIKYRVSQSRSIPGSRFDIQ